MNLKIKVKIKIKTLFFKLWQNLDSTFCFILSYFQFLFCSLSQFTKRILFFGIIVFCLVFVVKIINFNSIQNSKAQSLPNCASLPESVSAQAGINCLYFGLPLCKDVVNPKPRQNCADLIDLPLCSQIVVSSSSPQPGKNCVELCSDSAYNDPDPNKSPSNVRGQDYAIFNKDCIRFCDDVESGVVAKSSDPGRNCAPRKCHQLENEIEPNQQNCDLLKCNLLTPDELNKSKFDDATKKYCDGDDLKCYEFTQSQLPFVRMRLENPICKIHDCRPESSTCGEDDTLNIINKGETYLATYEKFINAGFDISNTLICNVIECRPIIQIQYRCVDNSGKITGDDEKDVIRNSSCNQTGSGSVCNSGYCFETLDCNLPANNLRGECQIGRNEEPNSNYQDPFDSWFYRPKPLSKAVNSSGILLRHNESGICYTKNDLKHHGWGDDVALFGYFHDYLGMDTRSPGSCEAPKHGHRGTGYSYLCGTSGNLYSKPSDYSSYYAGYVRTTFYNNSAKHVIRICTRFTNTMTLNACGRRECGITYSFGRASGQTCGGDICKDFEIEESQPIKCMMTDSMAQANRISGCSQDIDSNIRIRAVQYSDRICGFIDSKGQLSYKKMFLNGKESLEDGKTCVNDPEGFADSTDGCNGYDSNEYEGLADKWRALIKIPYVQNNRPPGEGFIDENGKFVQSRGYLDYKGRLFNEQECPKITLRIPPPDQFNLGNILNSERLFLPPLYIRNAIRIRDGEDLFPDNEFDAHSKTDFHFPEIRVQYGNITSKMSLGIDEISGEDGDQGTVKNYSKSPAYQKLIITSRGKDFIADIFVKKEFDDLTRKPLFCLYRRIQNQNGLFLSPVRVGCVEREIPEIDSQRSIITNPAFDVRKTLTNLKAGSKFSNSEIELRYLAALGSDKKDDKCLADDLCSTKIALGNKNYSTPTCKRESELYEICVQREECSQIFIECAENEINFNNALNNNESTLSFQSKRFECDNNLAKFCARKLGINDQSISNIYDINPNKENIDPKIYGWYNEICAISGFNTKLKDVIAYSLPNNILGKCKISPLSPYLQDSNPNTNCDDGGFAPNCLCVEAVDGYKTVDGEVIRKETQREAGLCVDMPKPKICPAIIYDLSLNQSNVADPHYIMHSLGKNEYNDFNGVHISHKYRSQGKPAPNEIKYAGHAEFSANFYGVDNVRGRCEGFWTYQKNAFGITLYPQMNCLEVSLSEAKWDYANLKNPCIRYSCPQITTFGPDRVGKYQGGYDGVETGENKGLTHGFAIWPQYTKTNDFMENVTANSCIAGFKALNSVAVKDNSGEITGYNGGTLPSRFCDQIGGWRETSNNCQRIQCPRINPDIPQDENDMQAWNQWFESGGATFDAINASRSSVRIQNEAIQSGSCNNDLGFFQSPGAPPPSRKCDYLGNWSEVENVCVSTCDAITTDEEAKSLNNGFAKWKEAVGVMTNKGVEGEFVSCVSGYKTYPYPPMKDVYGSILPEANDLSRPAENPQRLCRTGRTSLGAEVSVWTATINPCINKCPSAETDPRIGVGKTKHQTLDGEITINWPDGEFGKYTYITNWTAEEEHLSATEFQQNRTNRFYLLKRFCGNDGKWQDPLPLCSANNGRIGNATYYRNDANPGYENSIAVSSQEKVEGICTARNWESGNGEDKAPTRECLTQELNGQQIIDRTYLSLADGTKDCEEITCPILNDLAKSGTSNDRADLITNRRYRIGEVAQASCVNSDSRGIWTTLSEGSIPQRICQEDGSWSELSSYNSCKKNCILPLNSFVLNADVANFKNRCNNGLGKCTRCDGGGIRISINGGNVKHNARITYGAHEQCHGRHITSSSGFICQDGTLQFANSITNTNGCGFDDVNTISLTLQNQNHCQGETHRFICINNQCVLNQNNVEIEESKVITIFH